MFSKEECKEDKHKIWLSFRATDRSFACPKCGSQTLGVYPPLEMERLAKIFVDRIFAEKEIPFAGMDSAKEIIPLKKLNEKK